MRWTYYFAPLLLLAAFVGCQPDDPVENQPPETRIFLDQINRSGTNRLESVVELHWWGEDADGVVVGYEISQNQTDWTFVEVTDSVFVFSALAESDTADITFFVRAVDDEDLRDPTPAELVIPIKNTEPEVVFDASYTPFDTTLCVWTQKWDVSDIDGFETLDSVYLKINDSQWVGFAPEVDLVTLVPENPTQPGSGNAALYAGTQEEPLGARLGDFRLDGFNTMYVRARDKGGLESAIDTSKTLFVLARASETLYVNGWRQAAEVLQPEITNAQGIASLDEYSILDPDSLLPQKNVTEKYLFQLYERIYWVANNLSSQYLVLESSGNNIQNFLNDGGKFFLMFQIPRNFETNSAFISYSPIDSVPSFDVYAAIRPEGSIIADEGAEGYSDMLNASGGIIGGLSPFQPKAGAEVLYVGELVSNDGSPWNGPTTLVARLRNAGGNTNMIYCNLPLQDFAEGGALAGFFAQVNNDFDW